MKKSTYLIKSIITGHQLFLIEVSSFAPNLATMHSDMLRAYFIETRNIQFIEPVEAVLMYH